MNNSNQELQEKLAKARELSEQNEIEDSIAYYGELINLEKTNSKIRSIAFYELGLIRFRQQKDKAALHLFKNALKHNCDHPNLYYVIGEIYQRQNNFPTACEYFRKSFELLNSALDSKSELYLHKSLVGKLQKSDSLDAKRALNQLGTIQFNKKPPISFFTGEILTEIFKISLYVLTGETALTLGLFAFANLFNIDSSFIRQAIILQLIIWIVIVLVYIILAIIGIKATRYQLKKGRLKISTGWLGKEITYYIPEDLYKIEFKKNLWQQKTKKASLILQFKQDKIELGGNIQEIRELHEALKELMILVKRLNI